jgi:hypothetical protein
VELHFGTGAQWCLAFNATTASSGEGDRRFTAGPSASPAHCR